MNQDELINLISQWNANRYELFALSQPNEDGEFFGVMRFCFQDSGQKVATKCVRVSSTATTTDVIQSLIEKFRADIRMLSVPEYGLYEIHENGEERKLADDEKPLMVQLNWHKDDREGRFLLRRMDEKSSLPAPDPEANNLRRKLSKREKKDKKKKEKREKSKENSEGTKDGLAESLYTELPETCLTRSISNPEAVMRRRRKQKLEKKLQQLQEGGPDAGGTLRIFGECLNKDVPYKTLLLSTKDTAAFVVEQILDKYRDIDKNLREAESKEMEPASNYCLVQVIEPYNTGGNNGIDNFNDNESSINGIREYILDDDDCPLAIKQLHNPSRGQLTFHIKKRPADYQPRKRKKKPNQLKGDFEQGYNPSNNSMIRQMSDTSSTSGNVMPDNYPSHQVDGETIRKGKEPILPAILELWEEGEHIFLNMIITRLNPEQVIFKLAPTYTLYMAIRYRASTHFKRISPEERAHRLTIFVNGVAELIHLVIREKQKDLGAVTFWLANSSELLHFLKQDRHLSPYTVDAQDSLAESVQAAYSILANYSIDDLYMAIPSFLEDPDQDGLEAAKTSNLLQVVSNTMALLKRCRVNAALTIQLFSRLFHMINMWLFNEIVNSKVNYCSEHRALVLKSRLSMIGNWAHKNGLELAAQCYLNRIEQALDLLIVNRRVMNNPASYNRDFFKLNSKQVRRLLERFEEPPIPQEIIETIVRTAEANADELARNDGREIKLEEDQDLRLPFLLPDDGYTCEIVIGMPSGLEEFIYPLVAADLCRFTIQPTSSGYWTIYMTIPKVSKPIPPVPQQPQIQQNAIHQPSVPLNQMNPSQLVPVNSLHHHPQTPIPNQVPILPPQTPQPQQQQQHQQQTPVQQPQQQQPPPPPPQAQFQQVSAMHQHQVNQHHMNQHPHQMNQSYVLQPSVPPPYLPDNGHRIYDNLHGVARSGKFMSEPMLANQTLSPSSSSTMGNPYVNTPVIIQLQKSGNGLGLSIVAARSLRTGRLGIYIKSVVKGGAAELDGRLQPGDQLLSVDNQSLIDIPQEMAAKLMTQTDTIVTLEVAKQAAYYNGLSTFLTDSSPHIQRATPQRMLPPPQQNTWNQPPPPPMSEVPQYNSHHDDHLRYRIAGMANSSQTLPPNSMKSYSAMAEDQLRLRMAGMTANNQSISQNSLKSFPGSEEQMRLRISGMSGISASNQSISQNSLKKNTCPPPAVSYRYGRSGYPPKNDSKQLSPRANTATPAPSEPQQNNQTATTTSTVTKNNINNTTTINNNTSNMNVGNSSSSTSNHQENGPIRSYMMREREKRGERVEENSHHPPPLPKSPPPQQRLEELLRLSSSIDAAGTTSSNIITNSGTSKKVSWNGSSTIPNITSSSLKMSNSGDHDQYSPTDDHSFTLKDISEVLEMDDENDPSNPKGGYTPNVIGAHEVYKDPRERIAAEKMNNQPQKAIIPGPEKLTFKEKMKLFNEESNSARN